MCGKTTPADERQIAHSQLIITRTIGHTFALFELNGWVAG